VVEDCRRDTYVSTLAGRRRFLPNINDKRGPRAASERAQAERQAVNSVCQGSAADLVKRAMVQLVAGLKGASLEPHCNMVLQAGCQGQLLTGRRHLPEGRAACMHAAECAHGALGERLRPARAGGRLALLPRPCPAQIHDELLFEVRCSHVAQVAALVRRVLEGSAQLTVPLPVKLHSGPSWGEMQELAA
jgi:DNA polymerase theta